MVRLKKTERICQIRLRRAGKIRQKMMGKYSFMFFIVSNTYDISGFYLDRKLLFEKCAQKPCCFNDVIKKRVKVGNYFWNVCQEQGRTRVYRITEECFNQSIKMLGVILEAVKMGKVTAKMSTMSISE